MSFCFDFHFGFLILDFQFLIDFSIDRSYFLLIMMKRICGRFFNRNMVECFYVFNYNILDITHNNMPSTIVVVAKAGAARSIVHNE